MKNLDDGTKLSARLLKCKTLKEANDDQGKEVHDHGPQDLEEHDLTFMDMIMMLQEAQDIDEVDPRVQQQHSDR